MGTGKSTVGALLAERLGHRFVDTDVLIEARSGRAIPEIFSELGETAFRQIEHEVAVELASQPDLVIGTGGGMMLNPQNVKALGKNGRIFTLTASPDTILARVLADEKRIERPLLAVTDPKARILKLLTDRKLLYEQFPQIDTENKTPDDVADEIVARFKPPQHRWDLSAEEAIEVQQSLRTHISRYDQLGPIHTVAGVDVGFEDGGKTTRAGIVVLDFPSLTVLETAVAHLPTSMPYIPGLLSFREIPAVLEALNKLNIKPDLLLCDGQGIAHPRRFGLASHLGLLADIPTIGVAKTRFIGKHDALAEEKGAIQPLMDKGEQIGVVLRSRTGVKPLYISVGHRIGLETAVEYVLRCTPKYRLPETTRQAHKLASNL